MRNAVLGSFVGFLLGAAVLAACGGGGGVTPQADLTALEQQVADLQDLLAHFSRSGDDVYLTGANLHVRNGLDATGTSNGLGNVIVGYNETRTGPSDTNTRTGSHMLVVGKENNYASYGGILAGQHNEASGDYASVLGGYGNVASGTTAVVSGGMRNAASGNRSAVSGGNENEASGRYAVVSGGVNNDATHDYSACSGGSNTDSTADYDHRP